MKDMITKSFSEVFDLSLGRTPSRGNNLYWNGIHPWVSIADMSNVKYISQTKEKITDKALSDTHIPIVKKGTVIMSFKLTIGKVCITDCDIYTNEAIMAFTPKPQYKILPEFLFYYLMYYKWDKSNEVVLGCTLNKKSISQSLLSYPSSLAEQQRIVEILDAEFAKIDVLRANATKSLQAAKDLFQSALKQELQPKEKWKSYKLQDVCTEYGTYGMSLPSKVYDGIRYLRITDITEWGELNNEKVSADTKNIDDKYLLHDGDILFARTGATVGKTLVYNNTMGKCSYAGYLIRYRPNQEIILPQVLYYITHSKFYYNWVMTTQKSTTLPNISAKLYNRYEFSIPISLAEQTRIVSRLDQLNERCKTLQENYDRTITLCEDLKQALLRKAFNGEL